MKEFIAETARPQPKSTINSYRSFGYSLSTAIADIIDNSISAQATSVYIDYSWNGADSYVSVLDDGNGMTLEELVVAMTPGCKDPIDSREAFDLGRFGMGLKTASFSQCKRLTVATKKNSQVNVRCWDLDFINDQNEWQLLNFIADRNWLDSLSTLEAGTLVIWEKLDRIVGQSESKNEAVKTAFYNEFNILHDHISMVFHRFLEKGVLKLFLNHVEVKGWNPFLLNLDTKPEKGHTEWLPGNVEVTYFILPHMSSISAEDYKKSGGPSGWFVHQGFYIYRGDRLLVAGDWLGFEKKKDYLKLARISVSFSNIHDFEWNLDIKKSTATPPIEIRRDLERIARVAWQKSAHVYNWRSGNKGGKRSVGSSIQKLWFDEANKEGIKKYRINRSHELIRKAIEYDDKQVRIFSKALKLIEENVPIELILYNHNEDPGYHELEKKSEIPSDDVIRLAVELYKMNTLQGVPHEVAAQQILNSIPFNNFPLIIEYLK